MTPETSWESDETWSGFYLISNPICRSLTSQSVRTPPPPFDFTLAFLCLSPVHSLITPSPKWSRVLSPWPLLGQDRGDCQPPQYCELWALIVTYPSSCHSPEEEMVGWHYWLNGHESEQTPGDSGGQGGLAAVAHGVTKRETEHHHHQVHVDKKAERTSLVVQWLRSCLPIQGMRVWSLVGELRSCLPPGN